MTHPSPDELADYVADPTATASALADHLEQCASCAQEVTELRVLRDLLSEHRPQPLHTPRPQVWDAITQALAEEGDTARPVTSRRPSQWVLRTSRFLQIAAVGVLFGLLTGWLLWGPNDRQKPIPAAPTILASAILAEPNTSAKQGQAQLLQDDDDVALDITLRTPPKKGYLAVWLVDPGRDRRVQVGVLGARETSGHFTIARNLVSAGFKVIEVSRVADLGKPETVANKWARGELTPKAPPATRPTKSPNHSAPTQTISPRPIQPRPTRGASDRPSPTPSPTASSTASTKPSHSPRPRPSTSTQPRRKQLRAQVKACRVLLQAPRTTDPQDLEGRKNCRELLRWWRATKDTPPPQPKLAAPTQLQPEVLPQPSQT